MAAIITWISNNWQPVLLAILAVDAALIPVFPNAGILKSIQNFLGGLVKKPAA